MSSSRATSRAALTAAVVLSIAGLVSAGPSAAAAALPLSVTTTRDPLPDLDFEGSTAVDGIGEVLCNLERPGRIPVLRFGTTYEGWTKLVQAALIDLRFRPGPVDGVFGRMTEAAVRGFQTASRLVVDGRVGKQTWTALKRAWC